jgi:hypothetical protein
MNASDTVTNQIGARLREAARTLGFAHIAIANNDVGEALSDLTEVCLEIAAICEALAKPTKEILLAA